MTLRCGRVLNVRKRVLQKRHRYIQNSGKAVLCTVHTNNGVLRGKTGVLRSEYCHTPSFTPINYPLCIESPIMAPHLSRSTHTLINTMMQHGFTNKDIATAAQCSSRAIQRIRLSQTSPNMPGQSTTRVGRPSRISPAMQKALQNRLDVRPDMYRCDIVNFLERKFGEKVSERAVGRALKSMLWTRKINRRIAKQRDPDLRDWYLYQIADFKSYHFVFVDESGCDGRVGYRRWK